MANDFVDHRLLYYIDATEGLPEWYKEKFSEKKRTSDALRASSMEMQSSNQTLVQELAELKLLYGEAINESRVTAKLLKDLEDKVKKMKAIRDRIVSNRQLETETLKMREEKNQIKSETKRLIESVENLEKHGGAKQSNEMVTPFLHPKRERRN